MLRLTLYSGASAILPPLAGRFSLSKGLWITTIASSSTALLNAGLMDRRDLPISFYRSPEFQSKFKISTLDNRHYVHLLYLLLQQREPDPEGLKHWLDRLETGTSREAVFLFFIESPEFQSKHPGYFL